MGKLVNKICAMLYIILAMFYEIYAKNVKMSTIIFECCEIVGVRYPREEGVCVSIWLGPEMVV